MAQTQSLRRASWVIQPHGHRQICVISIACWCWWIMGIQRGTHKLKEKVLRHCLGPHHIQRRLFWICLPWYFLPAMYDLKVPDEPIHCSRRLSNIGFKGSPKVKEKRDISPLSACNLRLPKTLTRAASVLRLTLDVTSFWVKHFHKGVCLLFKQYLLYIFAQEREIWK